MSKEKETVLKFYQSFDERNIDKALEMLSSNFVAHMAGIPQPLDKNGFKQFGMEFYSAFLNSKHTFDQIIVEGKRVVTSGTFTATHLGSFQGLPPTKKQIEISIVHIDTVEEEKIVEHWGQGDAQGLMKQLGILFIPSPKLVFKMITNGLTKPFTK